MTNLTEIKNAELNYDLEAGFVWAEVDGNNVFQACLNARVDGKGFKKEISYSDNGFNDGVCGDYNQSVWGSDWDLISSAKNEFIKLASKNGFRIV